MTIRVVLVDDQPLQRAGFRLVLQSQPDMEVVGEAGDGAGALVVVRNVPTDVVVMDVRMPRVNGIVATERILADERVRSLGPPPRIVLLTALELDDHVAAAADAGAWTILYKDVAPDLLLEAIRGAADHVGD